MSVEILSVSLSDESIEMLARRVAQLLQGQGAPAPAVPPTPAAPAAVPPPTTSAPAAPAAPTTEYDPWAGTGATAAAPGGHAAPATAAPAAAPLTAVPGPSAAAPPASGGPVCAHGPMRYVPGGFSRSTNRPYPAFWACTTPKGDPGKCRSVPA